MSLATAKSIDVHAHVVLEQSMGAAGPYGPELGTGTDGEPWLRVGDYTLKGIRYQDSPFMDVDLRLQRMRTSGVDFQLLSPNPLTYFHFVDPVIAVDFCRTHNDAMASIVQQHPNQLAGLAALPVQDIAASCKELERAVTELGLLGAAIGAEFPFQIDCADLDVLYETFSRLDVPLFIHPAPPGLDGPRGDERLRDYDLDIILGFAGQEALAIARLIIGGVLDRHPTLDVCVSHGGGSIAMLAERLADGTRRRPWSPSFLRSNGAFEDMLSRIWVDNHVHDEKQIPLLTNLFGEGHVVLGTNFAGWDQPSVIDRDAPQMEQLANNARRLLRAG